LGRWGSRTVEGHSQIIPTPGEAKHRGHSQKCRKNNIGHSYKNYSAARMVNSGSLQSICSSPSHFHFCLGSDSFTSRNDEGNTGRAEKAGRLTGTGDHEGRRAKPDLESQGGQYVATLNGPAGWRKGEGASCHPMVALLPLIII